MREFKTLHELDAEAVRIDLETTNVRGLPLQLAVGHIRTTGEPYRCMYLGRPTIFTASTEYMDRVRREAAAAREAAVARFRERVEREGGTS